MMSSHADKPQRQGNRYRVVIADDLLENRELLRETIEPIGFDCYLAPSGEVAMNLAKKLIPDLILLDISMPGMGGFEALKALRTSAATASIPVVFITASNDVDLLVRAFDAGVADYIVTPFLKEEVKARLKTHVKLHRTLRALETEIKRREKAEAETESAKRDLSISAERLSRLTQSEASRWGIDGLIGRSSALEIISKDVSKLADSANISVVVTGESGVGKELVARAIHFQSPRKGEAFVPINCSAIPRDLAESMLFGHVKGAFSGAIRDQSGLFQKARGGTLFLDELGELPLDVQAKMLRALEENSVTPVGGLQAVDSDVRIIAATHRSLIKEIEAGRFREDLFYRLSRFCIHIPPLRERKEDILVLAEHFAKKFAFEMGQPSPKFTPEAIKDLEEHTFPGNVRELKNLIERAVLESSDGFIQASDLHFLNRQTDTSLPAKPMANPKLRLAVEEANTEILSEEESTIVLHVRERGHITNKICRQLLGVNLRRANYLLNRLVKSGHLSRAGSNRNAIYMNPPWKP